MIINYSVQGMTCEHCARAVTEGISAIPAVESAEVNLRTAR